MRSSCSREVARTTHVTLTYLPCRLSRISIVEAWKSGACRRTISVTVCAKPGCLRPITLIGNSQGNARADSCACTARPSGGNRLPLSGAHHRELEILVQAMHAPEYRPGLAAADASAIEVHDRQHFLG